MFGRNRFIGSAGVPLAASRPVEVGERGFADDEQRIAVGERGVRARVAGVCGIALPPVRGIEANETHVGAEDGDSHAAAASPASWAGT